MKVVYGFDEAVKGWIHRLAATISSTATDGGWNFTSDILSRLY